MAVDAASLSYSHIVYVGGVDACYRCLINIINVVQVVDIGDVGALQGNAVEHP
jgi:hypothetical protein